MISAISRAGLVKVPGGGAVDAVLTVCTQRRLLEVLRTGRSISLWLRFESTRPSRGRTFHHLLFIDDAAHASARDVPSASAGDITCIVGPPAIVFVRRLSPAHVNAPLRRMPSRLRNVPVLFCDAEFLHERHAMPMCGGGGRLAPDARLQPHDFDVPCGGLLDVARHRRGPTEDHHEINGTGHLGKRSVRGQPANRGAVGPYGNDVVSLGLQVHCDGVTMPRWVGTGADDGDSSSALQDTVMQRFLSTHVLHKASPPLFVHSSRHWWHRCCPPLTCVVSVDWPLRDRRKSVKFRSGIMDAWNAIVTARGDQLTTARGALPAFGRVERTGFYNVLTITVDAPETFLNRLDDFFVQRSC